MVKYSFYERRSGKIIFVIALFLLLLLARDTMLTSSFVGFYRSQFITLGIMAFMGILFLIWNRHSIKEILHDRRVICIGAAAVITLLPMLIKQDWQLMYFSILLCLFFAIFVSYFTTYERVAYSFVIMLAALSVYSLIAQYLLKPLADSGEISVPVVLNPNGNPFYNFGLSYVWAIPNYYRNFGVFREPGVYQYFLILAMYLNTYVVNWKKPWFMWSINGIFAVTMLTTFSTNGIIEVILFAVLVFFDKKLYKKPVAIIISVLMVAAVTIVVVKIVEQQGALYWAVYSIFEKLITWNYSASSRFDAIITDVFIFLQNPIFGEKISEVMYSVDHNTTSTLLLFCILGVVGGVCSVACWIALIWNKKQSIVTNLVLLLIMFMSFNTQNLVADIFFWLFPLMALIERGLPKLHVPKIRKKG